MIYAPCSESWYSETSSVWLFHSPGTTPQISCHNLQCWGWVRPPLNTFIWGKKRRITKLLPVHLQICKDKDEAEVWFTGLKALISRYHRRARTDPRSGLSSEANSPKAQTQRSSPLSSPFGSGDGSQKVVFFYSFLTVDHLIVFWLFSDVNEILFFVASGWIRSPLSVWESSKKWLGEGTLRCNFVFST